MSGPDLPARNRTWLEVFRAKHGRALRVLHIGNIANNAYSNAKLLNAAEAGSFGLFAPLYFDFSPPKIAAYVDENKTVCGSQVRGRPVGGMDVISELRIKYIALAIRPVYIANITQKLKPFCISIYASGV